MKIVILDSGYKSYEYEIALFEKHGFSIKIHPLYKGDPIEKVEFAKEADGLLIRHTIINEEFLSKMKNLKAVVRYGIGYDNIDVGACTRHGVKVANVQGYASHSVSDHALALMFSCTRGLWNSKKQLLHQFAAPPVEDIFELHDKTLGIIGLGRIGSKLSQKAQPLFKNIIAADPYQSPNYFSRLSIEKADLQTLLEQAHIISVNCNLTEETHHILDEAAFSQMKQKPVIINTSRGETVDETALLNALTSAQIHSVGLDVFENEPPTENQQKLIDHPRTICTGHYAWYSDRAAVELQKRAANNLLRLLSGEEAKDALN